MKIVVVGGSGFVGSEVVKVLHTRMEKGVLPLEFVTIQRRHTPHGACVQFDVCAAAKQRADCSVLMDAVSGADVLINLIGIKQPTKAQNFQNAHIDALQWLLELCTKAHIAHFVHVSVLGAKPGTGHENGNYSDTKWHAEQLLCNGNNTLNTTIIKPAVVFGKGDNCVTGIVRGLKHVAIFPVPQGGYSCQQPVHVSALANTIVDIALSQTCGTIEVAGPKKIPLRDMIQQCALALDLDVYIVGAPYCMLRLIGRVMEGLFQDPLITRSQIKMLNDGMVPSTTQNHHQCKCLLVGPSFSVDTVKDIVGSVEPFLGIQARLLSAEHVKFMKSQFQHRSWLSTWGCTLLLPILFSVVYLFLIDVFIKNVWWNHFVLYCGFLLSVITTYSSSVPIWSYVLRWQTKHVLIGLLCGVGIWGVHFIGTPVVEYYFPSTVPLKDQLYTNLVATSKHMSPITAVTSLFIICFGEDLLWRILLPWFLMRQLGCTEMGGFLSCTLASVVWSLFNLVVQGNMLLVFASVSVGTLLSCLALYTGALWPPLFAHLVFDVLSFWLLPL